MKTIFAEMLVDEEVLCPHRCNKSIENRLEEEMDRLDENGVSLEQCLVFDAFEDDNDEWVRYVNYLISWSFSHSCNEFKGMSPSSYDEWKTNEDESAGRFFEAMW